MIQPDADNPPRAEPSPKPSTRHTLRFYERWWILANALTDGLLQHIWQAIYRFSKHGTREAAALSYYAVFSLFPLALLVIIVIGSLLGPAAAQNQIDGLLRLFVPESGANFVQENLEQALEQRGSFGIVAGLSLLWSSLGLFSNLSGALSRTFRDENQFNTWQSRLVGLGIVLALALLLFGSLASTAIFGLVDLLLFYQTTSWLSMGAVLIPLSLSVAIFAFLFRFIPRRKARWDAIWVAAFLAGGAWEIAKRLFTWYLDNLASYNLVYGSVATVIVLLFWAYMTAFIILLGAEFCVSFDDWMSKRSVQDLEVPYTDPDAYFS